MRTAFFIPAVFALSVFALAGAAYAQEPDAANGEAVFNHLCVYCHGDGPGDDGRPSLPGTQALQIKYQGAQPALLTERTDLNAAVLTLFVRQGTMSMPPFRQTELSDSDIADIAAYLARDDE